jgi:hypothetical protein
MISRQGKSKEVCTYHKDNRDDPGNQRAPVETAVVPVLAMGSVQIFDIYIALAHHEVVGDKDAQKRTEEDAVAAQESEEPSGVGKDVPRADAHAEQVSNPHASLDIEISGEECHEIGAERDDVGTQISNAVGKEEKGADEEDGGPNSWSPVVCKDIVFHSPLNTRKSVITS